MLNNLIRLPHTPLPPGLHKPNYPAGGVLYLLYPAWAGPAALGCRCPAFAKLTWKELLERIRHMQTQLSEIESDAQALITAEKADWLTTAEFARLAGLKPKTVTNYARDGRYSKIQRLKNGQYLIHKSELS